MFRLLLYFCRYFDVDKIKIVGIEKSHFSTFSTTLIKIFSKIVENSKIFDEL